MGLLIGAGSFLLGVAATAFVRPFSAWMEQRARSIWNQAPVIVSVQNDPAIIWGDGPDWQGASLYLDDPIRLREQHISLERNAWFAAMRSLGAVDAHTTPLRVTIQAKADAAVVIECLRVVAHRSIELDRGVVITRSVGGADLTPRRYVVDLDGMGDPIVYWDNAGEESGDPPSGYMLSAGEAERFHIWAQAGNGADTPMWHEWVLELDLLVEGRTVRHRIDNDGSPFVTVAPGNLPWGFATESSFGWAPEAP